MAKNINKKNLLSYLHLNFPDYSSYEILELQPDHSSIILDYKRDGKIKIEVGLSDGYQFKLLSTNFI